jgi:hypothetical protein
VRYWIESKEKFGQRFCSQTKDPRSGKWCKAKCGTYCLVAVIFLDEEEHTSYEALEQGRNIQDIEEFKNQHFEHLDDFQKEQLKESSAVARVMDKLKFKVVEGKADDQDIERDLAIVNKAIQIERAKIDF